MNKLEMSFDPNTIEHLGIRMYSTLPPVIAELIANGYDADAKNIKINLVDNQDHKVIMISDDGHGMSFEDINEKFLRIGRNRRDCDGGCQTTKNGRKVIGKKGLGKLSFFGIAHEIEIETIKDGILNSFAMEWAKIIEKNTDNSLKSYEPLILKFNEKTKLPNGTNITLKKIQRDSDFDIEAIANNISRYFILDKDFSIYLQKNEDESILIDNNRRYSTLKEELTWNVPVDIIEINEQLSSFGIIGHLLSTEKPISPNTNMRGVTLFSRKKLVNLPEYFSDSTSSHFFSYLTGWLEIDFIDDLGEDVIGTNRQSLNWEHPEMAKLKIVLQNLLKWLERDWRKKRKDLRRNLLNIELVKRGMNVTEWLSHVPKKLNDMLDPILESLLEKSEFTDEEISGTVKNLRDLIPPYPYYHYQNLHTVLSSEVFDSYKNENYYEAVAQGVIKYIREIQKKSKSKLTDLDLIKHAFIPDKDPTTGVRPASEFSVTTKYTRPNGSNFETDTHKNISFGHGLLAYAMWSAFRNPIHHELASDLKNSGLYTEQDCLDALGLLSHLYRRLDDAQ